MLLSRIDRYFLKNLLRMGIFYTILPTLILWFVQSRKIFEIALGGATSIGVIAKLSLYLIPSILPYIIPFSSLLAVITVIVRLYNDSELCVMWASGLSPMKLMKSFMIFAFINVMIIFFINSFIAAQASRQFKVELLNVKNDIIKTALKPGLIQTPYQDMMLYIEKLKNHNYIEGFYLQQIIDNREIRVFTAQKALLKESEDDFQLLLMNGRILQWQIEDQHKISSNKNGSKSPKSDNAYHQMAKAPILLEFEKFTFNISDIVASLTDHKGLNLKARDYSIFELFSGKTAKTMAEKNRFIARGHAQITNSLLPLIFILCAVLCLLYPMPPRGFPYYLLFKTIILAVLFRIVMAFLENLSSNEFLYIYIIYAINCVIIILILGYIGIKRRLLR